jgi:hypothetical protein
MLLNILVGGESNAVLGVGLLEVVLGCELEG